MTLMLPDDVIAPTYTMSNDLKGITEPAPPTLYPQAPDAFWANVNPPKFLFCSDPSWRSDVPTYQPHRHNKHTRLSRVLYPSINLQIYDAKYILCSALTLCWSTVQ